MIRARMTSAWGVLEARMSCSNRLASASVRSMGYLGLGPRIFFTSHSQSILSRSPCQTRKVLVIVCTKMMRIRAEIEARGEARGEAKGEVKGARMMVLAFVQMRFPALLDQTRKKVKRVTTADELKQLFQQLINAADEDAARSLLT